MPVAKGLKDRGWNVRTVRDEDMLGDTDKEQLNYAVENNWVLVTFDDDFLSLVEREGLEHTGIIYVNQAGRDIGEVIRLLDKYLDQVGKIESIHYV
jgi:predicted nuclease of predicted toxin-antitoxin system